MQNKFQEKFQEVIANQQSFLLFRQPNSSEVELWLDEEKNDENQFVFHRFDDSEHIIFSTDKVERIAINELVNIESFSLEQSSKKEAISYENYLELISKTVEELNTTSTEKIVISRIKEIENEGVNLIKTFKNLHQNYPKAFVYLWFTKENGLWIGASPELLLEEENLTVKTVSLAGTLPKEEEWTSKEIHEQQVVTDYIVSNLQDAKSISVNGPHTVDAGFFNHLKSYISAEVDDYEQVNKILNRLHPTPAVCGMPKQEAKNFILANEGYDRKYYAGYFGFKMPEKSLYFVNLRCAQIFSDVVKLYVGGGIMPDSNSEKEWQETELKSKTIGNLLVTD
ncbi:isochorismate synthase [Faecalibacter macacae]|uniref:isochorismate synthase n=1 Tax=Faecalibacter macacae TaxID=1859289 RepID=A0A3L9M4S8_9FLAO|nr:isochorismate synthase [Faecalibacter macacae]RLZ07781.1 isochorismate synthase [Faecalibacter macacae]